jgi:dTDP-4-dehydrorhamnose reductase
MMKTTWLIIPENEGQELNYIEDFVGDMTGAEKRAKYMADGLQRILKDGTITVSVKNSKTLREIANLKGVI